MVLWLGMHVEIGFLNKDVRFDSAEYDARAIAADKGVVTGIQGSTTNFERTLEVGSRALYACNCTSANRHVGFGAGSDVEAFSHAYVSLLLSNNDCK